jgi:glycosyltransferase involved in cell wall biosynthesis
MERFSYRLAAELVSLGSRDAIANRRGRKGFPFFLPFAIAAATVKARKGKVDLIHLGDASLAPVGVALRRLTGLPVTATIHGLDVTFENAFYQSIIRRTLPSLDHLIAVSSSTRDICASRLPACSTKLSVIPNGVDEPNRPNLYTTLSEELEDFVKTKSCLLAVGRLVKRKGVCWFVDTVMPRLPRDTALIVVGEGNERPSIEASIKTRGLSDRVLLLGRVAEDQLELLYSRADLFVMPNIAVPGDVEGFGLVALEAAVRGLPVVAADLQGIPEAIHHGRNGLLVSPTDPEAFASQVREVLDMSATARIACGEAFQAYTRQTFSWRRTAEAYWERFEDVCASQSPMHESADRRSAWRNAA